MKREQQVYTKMIQRIEQRMQAGHPQFGDSGLLKMYKEKLSHCK